MNLSERQAVEQAFNEAKQRMLNGFLEKHGAVVTQAALILAAEEVSARYAPMGAHFRKRRWSIARAIKDIRTTTAGLSWEKGDLLIVDEVVDKQGTNFIGFSVRSGRQVALIHGDFELV